MKIIHVNRNVLNSNRKNGKEDPAITVKDKKSNRYGHKVDILDKNGKIVATIIQAVPPIKPLSCGARVFINCKYGTKIHKIK